jgi:hypothetical protein
VASALWHAQPMAMRLTLGIIQHQHTNKVSSGAT